MSRSAWESITAAVAEGMSWGLSPEQALAAFERARPRAEAVAPHPLQGIAAALARGLDEGLTLSQAAARMEAPADLVARLRVGEEVGDLRAAGRGLMSRRAHRRAMQYGVVSALLLPLLTALMIMMTASGMRRIVEGLDAVSAWGGSPPLILGVAWWGALALTAALLGVIIGFGWARQPRLFGGGRRRQARLARALAATFEAGLGPAEAALDDAALTARLKEGAPLEGTLREHGYGAIAALLDAYQGDAGEALAARLRRRAELLELEADAGRASALHHLRGWGTIIAAALVAAILFLIYVGVTDLSGGLLG